ncbi:hypothetical protein [Ancylobacter radicis]|uniref:Uncharacterized protein n=1 Tax=Ancylobacter radicis TaxID=2836179 RepID=A0ABS5R3L7_9HYPH|nr:hypothetical protein [Ancylobacter radicis]MBS9476254.1 hypothetical protein [Ancylobacter radicis]
MMGALLDLFPAWANSLTASGLLLAGIAGVLYGLFPLAPYGRVVQILAAGMIGYACYLGGYAGAQAACEADSLRQQLADTNRDLTAVTEAAADASRRAAILDETLEANQHRIDAYEAELAARPADSRCALRSDDIRGLLGGKP